MELEFSGPIEFSNVYFPISQAVNVQDNVWFCAKIRLKMCYTFLMRKISKFIPLKWGKG